MRSNYFQRLAWELSSSTTISILNKGKWEAIPIPLPPLAEQHRIVAKVDELMALCDQLEQQTEASLGAHQTLVETLLSALTSAADHAQFVSAWQRIAGHFDTLFTTEESIAQLKQTILQLAVMGKLVPQDPNDEPASELLKKIAAEKARLVKEGKVRKEKPLPPIADEEKPFALPSMWVWTRLGELSWKITDGEHISPKKTDRGVPLLSAKDVTSQGILYENPQYVTDEDAVRFRQRCNPEPGDILICSRGTIGRCAIVESDQIFCLMGSVILVKTSHEYDKRYVLRFLQTNLAQEWMLGASYATAVSALYLKDVTKCLSPLPPLPEQHRIVAKVDELMALCDQLKSRLSAAQTTQLHLADALVEQAIC